jgi:hypothetical protein
MFRNRTWSERQAMQFNGAAPDDSDDNDAIDFRSALRVLDLAKDAVAIKGHIDAMAKATAEAADARKALSLAADAHEAKVAADTKRLDQERTAWEKERSKANAEIEARHAHATDLHNKATMANNAAVQLRSQLEAKLARIQEAARG